MTRQNLILWDCAAEPPATDDLVYRWDGYESIGRVRSLLAYVETRADALRHKYLAWIHDVGESRLGDRRLVEHFALEKKFSFWWMSLLVEKNPWKSPSVTDAIRLLAFEELVKQHRPLKIQVVTANRSIQEAVGGLCRSLGISCASPQTRGKRLRNITARDAYHALPQTMQALIGLIWHVGTRWRFRRKHKTAWFEANRAVFFCSYFIHLDEKLARDGRFYSRQWEVLPQLLHDSGYHTNWLQHYLQSSVVPTTRVARNWVDSFNRRSEEEGCHAFLDGYLSWKIVFRVLIRLCKLIFVTWRLRTQQLRASFQPRASNISLWPVMRRDWYASMIGSVATENLLLIELFDAALRDIPPQQQGLYLCEGQAWERALIHSWRKHGHGRLVAVAHSTVRYWDLRYFSDNRTLLSEETYPMPQPDFTALNGRAAVEAYLNASFPKNAIVECEALRYGYLSDLQPRRSSRRPLRAAINVLIVGDIVASSTGRLLYFLQAAMPRISVDVTFTVKPHPKWTVNPADFPALRFKVSTDPLAEILGDFDVAYSTNLTSAAVDAYFAGLAVVVMLYPNELNFSPLRGQPAVCFVSTATELAEALQTCVENSEAHSAVDGFFFLDADLRRWKRLLKLNAAATERIPTGAPLMPDSELSPIVKWLDAETLRSIYSSHYWNDLEAERSKEWWIAEGSYAAFARLQSHLEESGLMAGYRIAEQFVAQIPQQGLAVADLASGIGWTSSLLSRLPNVGSVHSIEISQHRLELLFPQAVRMFHGEPAKLNRNLGSFYEMSLADSSIDVVFVSSAFHHASNPLRLLMEIDRILKPGGKLILIGENFISKIAIVRRIVKTLARERRLCFNFYELFPPDDVSGDHYYRISDYYLFLQMLGYKIVQFNVQQRQLAAIISEKNAA